MQNKAYKFFNKINKSPTILQPLINRWFKSARVIKIELIKDKYIIDDQYKILSLITLKHWPQKTLILEIHDNLDYWQRSIFALKNFSRFKNSGKPMVAKLFYANKKMGIIFREDINVASLNLLIAQKKISKKKLAEIIKIAAWWLAQLHAYPIKKITAALKLKLNLKIEKKILYKTLEFIKPNIEGRRRQIKKNLDFLLSAMANEKRFCLIHGDYQPANMMIKDGRLKIIDFDTLEVGHPGRDLGRFSQQINTFASKKTARELNQIFLAEYFKHSQLNYENVKKSIALHQAEMIQYNILDAIWGGKIPNTDLIKKLINKQTNLLKKYENSASCRT